jgi:WD40 repeat protein
VASVQFTADGRLFTPSRWGARLWDVSTGKGRIVLAAEAPTGCLAADGEAAFVLRGKLVRVDLATARAVGEAEVPGGFARNPCYCAATRRIAVASMWGYDVHFWPWPALEPRTTWDVPPAEGPVTLLPDMAFSPDGAHLASIDDLKTVSLRTVPAGEQVWAVDVQGVWANGVLAFSPDGKHIAAASGTRLTVLDARTGAPVASARLARKHYLHIAFTPDGRFLAGVSKEGTVKAYETASWTLKHELDWEVGDLKAVAFSPDGMLGAARSGGPRIVVWDVDW